MKQSFSLRQPNRFLACEAILVVLFWNTALHAAVFYVDFNGGNDASSGTNTAAAWKTIPGCRKTDNSGYVSTAFGGTVFTYNANKVPAGTTFKLKCGTSFNGWIQIDSLWYADGTSANPITIQTDTNWGSGSITVQGAGATVPDYRGLINIDSRKYLKIDGMRSSGIIVTNCHWNGVRAYDTGTNGLVLRNLELGNAPHALVGVFSSDAAVPLYYSDVTIDGLIVHDGTGTADTDSLIYGSWWNGFVITNCTCYNSAIGSDGIHVESSHYGWILNCTIYDCGEQGIDLSRNGSYKTRDDSSYITVRDCIAYNNYDNNFDHNSGTHHVVWLNCFAFRTTHAESGSPNFNVHQGTAGPNWWINCSSCRSFDRGFSFGWSGNPWNIPSGVYTQRLINCASSLDSTYSTVGSRGGSVWIDADTANGCTSAWQIVNCVLNTTSASYGTVNYKYDTWPPVHAFTASDVATGSEGWFGVGCLTNSPNWKSTNATWSVASATPNKNSLCLNGGAFIFTTSSGAANSTTLTVTSAYGLDATRVFRAGDMLMVQGAGTVQVSTVSASDTIILSTPLTCAADKGVGFFYGGSGPLIGAYLNAFVPSPRNLRREAAP